MAISYTNNFNLPLLDDGAENAGAVNNGVYADLDLYLAEVRSLVCMDGDVMTYNDNVIYYLRGQ